jgi:hypothetical protein
VSRGKEEESMIRSNLRRGVTAFVFAAALTVAGAQPAAAEGLGWREAWDWLSRLWGGCGLEIDPNGDPRLQGATESVDAGFEIDPSGGPTTNAECGPEIDPSGKPVCKPTGMASGG